MVVVTAAADDAGRAAAAGLAARLAAAGQLTQPSWIRAFQEVYRHAFVPRFFWPAGPGRWEAVDHRHPAWLRRCYTDAILVVQLDNDDGSTISAPGAGWTWRA